LSEDKEQIISLREASKITGYSQDYLGDLCREGKLKGQKIGRNWTTTIKAIDELTGKFSVNDKPVFDFWVEPVKSGGMKQSEFASNFDFESLGNMRLNNSAENFKIGRLQNVYPVRSSRKKNISRIPLLLGGLVVLLFSVVVVLMSVVQGLWFEWGKIYSPLKVVRSNIFSEKKLEKVFSKTDILENSTGKVLAVSISKFPVLTTDVALPSEIEIRRYIDSQFNILVGSGLLNGPKGDKGDTGAAGANGVIGASGVGGGNTSNNLQPVYIPVGVTSQSQPQNYNGASLFSATNISGENFVTNTLQVKNIRGTSQCLQVDANGFVGGTGAVCGAGGGGSSIGGAVTGATAGSVLFAGSGGILQQDNANIFWDDTTDRLGIGDSTPLAALTVGSNDLFQVDTSGNTTLQGQADLRLGDADGSNFVAFQAPTTVGSNVTWTLPNADGSGCFQSNGSGIISISSCGGGPAGTGSELQYRGGAATLSAVSGSSVTSSGYLTLGPGASSSGSPNLFTVTGPAHTTLVADTEASDILFNLNRTVQFSQGAGTFTRQSAVLFKAPTYAFTSSDTITTAASVWIAGAPVVGTNAAITNNFSLLVTDSTRATNYFGIKSDGSPTSPDSGLNSERYGSGSGATNTNASAFGNGATASGAWTVALGATSTASGSSSTALGQGSTASQADAIAIGASATSSSNPRSIVIGSGATGTGGDNIIIGAGATGESSGFSNQFIAGSNTSVMTNVYFGKGRTSSSPTAYTINGTGGSGTDIAGAALQLGGGKGTGTGNGGSLILQAAYPSSTGSTLNSLSSIVTILGDNNDTSGMQNLISITPIVNQSGTAGYTSLLINTTETSTGSGTKLLADFQVGSTSRVSISSLGDLTLINTGRTLDLASSTNGNTFVAKIPQLATTGTCASAAVEGLIFKNTGGTQVGHACIDGPTSGTPNKLRFYAEAFNATSTDLAENYSDIDNILEPGDVVVLDERESRSVKLADKTNGEKVIGVISTSPGILLTDIAEDTGQTSLKNPKPLALAGRVPVKVTNENGDINIGDYLTLSNIKSGYAMKAMSPGIVIGKSLEKITFTENVAEGLVLVFVQPQYYMPTIAEVLQFGQQGPVYQAPEGLTDLNLNNAISLRDLVVLDTLFVDKELVVGKLLQAADIKVKKFTIGSREKPTGFTLYDTETSEPYCVSMSAGQLVKQMGECGSGKGAKSPVVTVIQENKDVEIVIVPENPAAIKDDVDLQNVENINSGDSQEAKEVSEK